MHSFWRATLYNRKVEEYNAAVRNVYITDFWHIQSASLPTLVKVYVHIQKRCPKVVCPALYNWPEIVDRPGEGGGISRKSQQALFHGDCPLLCGPTRAWPLKHWHQKLCLYFHNVYVRFLLLGDVVPVLTRCPVGKVHSVVIRYIYFLTYILWIRKRVEFLVRIVVFT